MFIFPGILISVISSRDSVTGETKQQKEKGKRSESNKEVRAIHGKGFRSRQCEDRDARACAHASAHIRLGREIKKTQK